MTSRILHSIKKTLTGTGTACGIALLLAVPVHAEIPFAESVPAGAPLVVGISNTAEFWNRIEQLPVTAGIKSYLQNPSVTQNLDYQQFQLERQKAAQALGYEADFKTLLGEVFNSMLFYASPAAAGQAMGGGTPTSGALIFGIADEAKARKLMEVGNEKYGQPATADAAGTGSQTTVHEQIEIAGATVTHLREGQKDHYYGIHDDRFIYAGEMESFRQAVEGTGNAPAISSDATFSNLTSQIPWNDSDFVVWFNADTLAGSHPMGAMLSQMPGMTSSNKTALTFNFEPNAVMGRGVSTANPVAAMPNIQEASLEGARHVSPNPLVALCYGIFDAETSLRQFRMFSNMAGMFGGGMGLGGSGSLLDQFEQVSGISIEQDLVPALGQEITFSINDFQMTPGSLFPQVDMVFGVEAKDPAKLQSMMDQFENYTEQQMASRMGGGMNAAGAGGAPAGPVFQSQTVGGVTVRSMEIMPGMGMGFAYAIHDGFLLMSLNSQSLSGSLNRMAGNSSGLAQSPMFKQLQAEAGGSQPFSYAEANVNAIVNKVVRPLLPMVGMQLGTANVQQVTTVLDQIVSRLQQVASVETTRDGLTHSAMKVTMQ